MKKYMMNKFIQEQGDLCKKIQKITLDISDKEMKQALIGLRRDLWCVYDQYKDTQLSLAAEADKIAAIKIKKIIYPFKLLTSEEKIHRLTKISHMLGYTMHKVRALKKGLIEPDLVQDSPKVFFSNIEKAPSL